MMNKNNQNKYKTTRKLLLIPLTTMVMLLVYASSFAGNTNDFINQARVQRDEIIKKASKNNTDFFKFKKISAKKAEKMDDYQTIIEEVKNKHLSKLETKGEIEKTEGMEETERTGETEKIEKAIVFVSFSMPDLSLKQIIRDANYYQVPVVIRGLYKNSFRKTIEKIFELIKESNKGGIAINPKWFKEYGVKAVPAVVVIDQKHGVRDGAKENIKKSDIVYGNIPLRRALSIIAERGEATKVAAGVLNRGNGGNK